MVPRWMRTTASFYRSAVAFTLILVLWPPLAGLSAVEGTQREQLAQLSSARGLYVACFCVALLIAPAAIAMLLHLRAIWHPSDRIHAGVPMAVKRRRDPRPRS